MTSFQAEPSSLLLCQAQVAKGSKNSHGVRACSSSLENTASFEDDITETTDGKTTDEPESRVEETNKKYELSTPLEDEKHVEKLLKKVNAPLEVDEKHFENVLKKVNTLQEDSKHFENSLKNVNTPQGDKQHFENSLMKVNTPQEGKQHFENSLMKFNTPQEDKKHFENSLMKFNTPQEDERHVENLLKTVNVIKTVTLKLSNELDYVSLKDPDVFVISGKSRSLFKDIFPGETKCFLFVKTSWSWRGAVGICTYRVGKTDERIAIYYCNPFIGHNSFGLQWVTASHVTDNKTYQKLFSRNTDKWFVRDSMKEMKVKSPSELYLATAFMTQGEHAEMYVTVTYFNDD